LAIKQIKWNKTHPINFNPRTGCNILTPFRIWLVRHSWHTLRHENVSWKKKQSLNHICTTSRSEISIKRPLIECRKFNEEISKYNTPNIPLECLEPHKRLLQLTNILFHQFIQNHLTRTKTEMYVLIYF